MPPRFFGSGGGVGAAVFGISPRLVLFASGGDIGALVFGKLVDSGFGVGWVIFGVSPSFFDSGWIEEEVVVLAKLPVFFESLFIKLTLI